jgi:hypothetical protein
MNEDKDEFTGIFDDLTPEDFELSTSAFADVHWDQEGGEKAFNEFVATQITTLRTTFSAAEGRIQSLAVLANPNRMRSFLPEDDENLGQYLERLGREAEKMRATWFFISRVTMVGSVTSVDPIMFDAGDHQAESAPKVERGVIWFAARREYDGRGHRQGIMTAVGNHLGKMIEGTPDQTFGIFEVVLDKVCDD